MVQAKDVKYGDIISTDGFKVEIVVHYLLDNTVEIHTRLDDYAKVEKFERTKELPIWVED
jgi:hypothetical protein